MIAPKDSITGVISTDNKDYAFYLSDYCLKFLSNNTDTYESSNVKLVDGFANAVTHNGNKILFYVGKYDIPIINTMSLNLGSFLVSTSNTIDYDLSFFDGITFVGGTLKKLKTPKEIKFELDKETGRRYIYQNDDTQKFHFQTTEFSCEVEIGSTTTETHSLNGIFLSNDKVYCRMMFDKPQPTIELYKHYNKVKELLSFLTYRDNVGFDEIYLFQNNTPIGKTRTARVYIKDDEEYTDKDIYYNLTFQNMDGYLSEALRILYETTDKKRSYSLNIYPENDKRSTIITNEMVREVCSALECEIGFVEKIQSDESAKIKGLIKKIKPIIKEHKQSDSKLKDKTYSLIE